LGFGGNQHRPVSLIAIVVFNENMLVFQDRFTKTSVAVSLIETANDISSLPRFEVTGRLAATI
jgi:hypothetical protein